MNKNSNLSNLRNLSIEELEKKIDALRSELFYAKMKTDSERSTDTSIFKKQRRSIAQALTIKRLKQR